MGEAFVLPEKDMAELRRIVPAVGFESEEEFVVTAVEEKILRLKKVLFTDVAKHVKAGLGKHGVKPGDILQEFEETRRR